MGLPVHGLGIDDVEECVEQRIDRGGVGVEAHAHGLAEAGPARADGPVIGVLLAGSVGVSAGGVDDAGKRLHEVLDAPEASSGKVDLRDHGATSPFSRTTYWLSLPEAPSAL